MKQMKHKIFIAFHRIFYDLILSSAEILQLLLKLFRCHNNNMSYNKHLQINVPK